MADRRGSSTNRTFRPEPDDNGFPQLPTIAEILRLPAVVAGDPEVLSGADELESPVRWVHVSDSLGVAKLLDGGELLLSTGVNWTAEGVDLAGYVDQLIEAGTVGLMLELVVHHTELPDGILDACRSRGFPLIVLRSEVKFVAVTEAVHSRILAEHTRALRAREQLHTLFTGLSLRGSPADFIVAQIGEQLGSPVVLEGLRHHAVAIGGPGSDAESVLSGWEQRSRSAHRASPAGGSGSARGDEFDDWLVIPVEARGTRWGFLVALPGPPHPAGRKTVLEQGAVALALSRLADDDSDEWVRHSQQSLLRSLLGGRYSSEGAVRERFEAAGMPIRKHTLVGIAVAVRPLAAVVRAARDAARSAGLVAVVGSNPGPDNTSLLMALSIPAGVALDPALNLLVSALVSALAKGGPAGTGADLALAIGSPAEDITGLLASLDEATDLLRRNSTRPGHAAAGHQRGTVVFRSENRPLLRLVTSLAGDPRLQAHAEQILKPLIEHDLTTGNGDLLAVLAAFAAHPGNRTKAAAESHLSRSVFYQRIALIEDLLGMSLDDGEVISALHTALLARGSR